MILNISYQSKSQERDINVHVGLSYTFWESLKMGGSGSQKLIINDCHEIFDPYLKQLHSTKYCNIELRPKGIGLRFRYKLEAIGWFIPYTTLDYHHEDFSLKIQDQLTGFFMNLKASHRNRINLKFMNKMRQLAG
ncbi:hypothetical protein N9A68_00630 [Cyclobacteriaceae bacterium]|jgi:hypothetical protein|nr:hypothetical protein [Cyclobacteriaceae bacterium]MDB4013032.1 hypothetical protein [Cyclobacteriaceae bacterium]MDB4812283.1 hypothetical protein [Candidatus Pelagibacter sp.]MDB9939070.1 hypothetical protein [Cyclobacteriaceae bacterium]|tara:strand:+ start:96 stop:500 length:405 start_codon:yes stop_codon:yes gene_type:complete